LYPSSSGFHFCAWANQQAHPSEIWTGQKAISRPHPSHHTSWTTPSHKYTPGDGQLARGHEDVPSDEVCQAHEEVLGTQNKKLLFFMGICARSTATSRSRWSSSPARWGVSSREEKRPARPSSAAAGSSHPPVSAPAGWQAPRSTKRPAQHLSTAAACFHCPPPTCYLPGAREKGTRGRKESPFPVLLGGGGDAHHPRRASAAAAAPLQLFVAW
jgi:hypothetical protein